MSSMCSGSLTANRVLEGRIDEGREALQTSTLISVCIYQATKITSQNQTRSGFSSKTRSKSRYLVASAYLIMRWCLSWDPPTCAQGGGDRPLRALLLYLLVAEYTLQIRSKKLSSVPSRQFVAGVADRDATSALCDDPSPFDDPLAVYKSMYM